MIKCNKQSTFFVYVIEFLQFQSLYFYRTKQFDKALENYKKLEEKGFKLDPRVRVNEPLGFNDYNKLQQNAFCVISDSGTITEESSIMGFPAITIRQAHERPEGMDEGTVIMGGVKANDIIDSINIATANKVRPHIVNDYNVEHVGIKVVKIIMSYTGYINRTVWRKYD